MVPAEPVTFPLADLPPGGSRRCQLGSREVAVFRAGDEVFAIDGNCPHRRGPLDGEPLQDFVVTCPWHGWRFDVRTGISPDQPARVFCYKAEIVGGMVRISMPE
jgi:nitrite reductase/ring-hydroxylating ferredoxin subunit